MGKSNIAAGLGILLSAAGAKVALIDADLGLGNLDVLMGLGGGPTLAGVFAGRQSLSEVLVELPCGVRIAAGVTGLGWDGAGGAQGRAAVLEGVAQLRMEEDFILLDCGSGIGPGVRDFCSVAGDVIVVTTPEPTAMTDGYGLIKSMAMEGYEGRLSVLVNMAADRQEARASYSRVASVAGAFLGQTVFDAGYILSDPKVPAAVRRRKPVVLAYPRCPASRCLTALAAKLRPWSSLAVRARSGGVLRRIAGWFD